MMTVAMVDHLLRRGDKGVLVECDTLNPDVSNAYKDKVQWELD